MTKHVRAGYRKHQKATWAVTLAGAAAAALIALAIVVPALGAAATTSIPPASADGVTPTLVNVGGSNFSCTTNAGGVPAGVQTFIVPSPPNSTSPVTYSSTNTPASSPPLPANVTLTLTGYNGTKKGKFFDFNMSGATVFHVGVKGGNDSAWYNYLPLGGVTSDQNLHATLKVPNDPNSLYNASYTTFCYTLTTTIKGSVFLDNDGNGAFNAPLSTPPDAGQNDWTVQLFDTSSSPAAQVGSSLTTPSPGTDPAGSYTFKNVPIGGNYKVCVTPPSGAWDQSAPTTLAPNGNTACSSVSGALPAGRVIPNLPAAGATGQDFGNQPTFLPSCGSNVGPDALAGSSIVEYTAQLTNPNPNSTDCKPAVVMYSYLTGSQPYAIIHPTSSSGTNPFWVVERIRMMVHQSSKQNPVTLTYDDTNPYGSSYATMKMCTRDPRVTGAGHDFTLAEDPANVMPDQTADNGDPETTCMIQSTDLPSDGIPLPGHPGVTYNYEAYITTKVDGVTTPH